MRKDKQYLKSIIEKHNSGNCNDDELLELFEFSHSPEFESIIREFLPETFDNISIEAISQKEIKQNYNKLTNSLKFIKYDTGISIFKKYAKYAAVILLPLLIALFLGIFTDRKTSSEIGNLSFAVEKGNKGSIQLADGSKVWLNGNSYLQYSGKSEREVKLSGQAYFEIVHQDNDFFNVKTEYFDIIVYGTSFSVSSYDTDSTVEVSLLEGSIGIRDNGKDLFKIHPGQMILYSKANKHYSVIDKDMGDEVLWKEKNLVIRDLSEDQLFRKLSAWYQIDIKNINKDPQKRMYNLVITNESLQNMLDLISKLSPLDYKIEGKEVTIKFR